MADPAVPVSRPIRFGVYTVDVRAGEITKHGTRIRVQDRPFQILLILLSRPGEVVTREELRQQLWQEGTFVDFDRGISSAMNKLRSALADTAANPKFIETVGRKGYRFIYPLTEIAEPGQLRLNPKEEASEEKLPARSNRHWWSLAIVAALAITLAAVGIYFREHYLKPAKIRSIAVLPLKNLSSSADEAFFSEGLTDELTTKLASLPGLRLISRNSVAQYKDTQKSLPQVARELGVDGLVQGSVLRYGGKVRITVQLVEGSSGRYVWAASYEREQRDIIDLQNEVTRQIADSIRLNLNPAERQRLQTVREIDPQAHDDYLRGRSYWNRRTSKDLQTAIGYFDSAIRRDPGYAQAYAGLADSYALLAAYSVVPPAPNIEKARAAALKALALDGSLAEAHTSLALIYENYDWDWNAAEREYRTAIALDPNYATAHHWYGEFLAYMGRFAQSEAEYQRARQLDPFSLIIQADYAMSLFYARRYEASLSQFKAVEAADPHFPRAQLIADVYAQLGRFDEAIAKARTDVPADRLSQQARLAIYYTHTGNKRQAQSLVTLLESEYRGRELNPSPLICYYLATDQKERAISLLEKAFEDHFTIITWLKVDPKFDPIRQDPRFQALLKSVGLAQ